MKKLLELFLLLAGSMRQSNHQILKLLRTASGVLWKKSWGILHQLPGVLLFYTNFDQGHSSHISVDGDRFHALLPRGAKVKCL